MKTLFATLILLSSLARADMVACHITYGGQTRTLEAQPVSDPYRVPTVQVGSYFLFKLVFEQRTAIKTYVYADRDSGPMPLHQGIFTWPVGNSGPHGFTGLHFVYEPVRDGELEYWCELN
jgi:hypothetical protein